MFVNNETIYKASPFAALYFVYILSLLFLEFMIGIVTYSRLRMNLPTGAVLGYVSNLGWNVIVAFMFVCILMNSDIDVKNRNMTNESKGLRVNLEENNKEFGPLLELSVFSTSISALSEMRVFSYYHATRFFPIGVMFILHSVRCVVAHMLAIHIYKTNYIFEYR